MFTANRHLQSVTLQKPTTKEGYQTRSCVLRSFQSLCVSFLVRLERKDLINKVGKFVCACVLGPFVGKSWGYFPSSSDAVSVKTKSATNRNKNKSAPR